MAGSAGFLRSGGARRRGCGRPGAPQRRNRWAVLAALRCVAL